MEYKEALACARHMLKELPEQRRYDKKWRRKAASCSAKGVKNDLPHPGRQDTSTRATLLCAAIAHSRGRVHFKRMGHYWEYNVKAALRGENVYDAPKGKELDHQRKVIDRIIRNIRFTHDHNRRMDSIGAPERKWVPVVSEEELAVVEVLLG